MEGAHTNYNNIILAFLNFVTGVKSLGFLLQAQTVLTSWIRFGH